MSGLAVYYGIQNSDDTTLNVFFLPPTFKSYSEVKVKDIVEHFPLSKNGKYHHFRFHAYCDSDQKAWVDISNMNSKVPVMDNRVLIKVLEIKKPSYTKIFRSLYRTPSQTATSSDTSRQQQPQTQAKRHPGPEMHKAASEPRSIKVTPKTVPHVHSDEDLLGGDHTTSYSISPQPSDKPLDFDHMEIPSHLNRKQSNSETTSTNFKNPDPAVYNMSREELTLHKERQKEEAIQARLAFAQATMKKEEENQAAKEKAYQELEDSIRKWAGKDKQRNNIRTLLCTVHTIVWEGCRWNSLSLSDLMTNAQIKKHYYKAVTIFHPDKNQDGDYRQKYISERITNELNAAWDEFRKENNM
jgi:DnaJ domain.